MNESHLTKGDFRYGGVLCCRAVLRTGGADAACTVDVEAAACNNGSGSCATGDGGAGAGVSLLTLTCC